MRIISFNLLKKFTNQYRHLRNTIVGISFSSFRTDLAFLILAASSRDSSSGVVLFHAFWFFYSLPDRSILINIKKEIINWYEGLPGGRGAAKRRFQEIPWYKERRYDNVNHGGGCARSGLSGLSLDTKSDRICQKSVTRSTMARPGPRSRDFTHTVEIRPDRKGNGEGREGARAEGSPKTRASVCK